MAYDVFVSYAHEDKTIADAVCGTLEANRIRCWIAPRDILPSMDWGEAVLKAINDCRLIVLVFSSKSNVSEHVKNEVERAVSGEKPIIPFRVEEVKPSGSLALHLSRRHWLDALTPPIEKHIKKLLETVKLLLSSREEEREAVSARAEELIEPPKGLWRRKGIVFSIAFLVLCVIVATVVLNPFGKNKRDVLSSADQPEGQMMEIKRPTEETKPPPESGTEISAKLDQGVKAFDQGNYNQCIGHMEKVLEMDPENIDARSYIDRAQERKKEKLIAADQAREQIKAIKQPVKRPVESPPEPKVDISAELELGIGAFDRGDYDQCIDHMDRILEANPENINARDYWDRAKEIIDKNLIEQEIKDSLGIAQEAFQDGNYQECIDKSKRILELDPDNAQASKYLSQASLNIAPEQIREIVRQYTKSLNSNKLLDFYKNICSSEIYPNVERDTRIFLGPYDSFQSMASKISIRFEGISRAEISFVHIITAVAKKDGKRKELFRGVLKWMMEKRDEKWKILAINFYPGEEK